MDIKLKETLRYICHTRDMLDRKVELSEEESSLFDNLNTLICHYIENDKDFDSYLREKHMEDYTGLDDDAPDAFDSWLEDQDYEQQREYFDGFLTYNI